MPAPALRRQGPVLRVFVFAICVVLMGIFAAPCARGQDSLLVAGNGVSVYDPALNLKYAVDPRYGSYLVAVDPNNPRLAYIGGGSYIGVFDLSIGIEINRIYGACGYYYAAFAVNGKYLLTADCNSTTALDIIDVARQMLVRKVSLSTALGSSGQYGLASIVVVGYKAYVTSYGSSNNSPTRAAVVDLRTYKVRSIVFPAAGYFNGSDAPNAGVTPDQKYVVIAQDNNNGSSHLYCIDTKTDRVAIDVAQTALSYVEGILITPVNIQGGVYGYLLGPDLNTGKEEAIVVDLNTGLPSFGELYPGTAVNMSSYYYSPYAAAISSDGTRLAIGGYTTWTTSPPSNVFELDTGAMFTSPTSAVIKQVTAFGGSAVFAVSYAPIDTTIPPNAPAALSVTGPIVNDAPSTITVTGTGFLPGVMVRIGTMPPLPANVSGPASLTVTVPQNAPAGALLNLVVTNPNLSGPRNQQYQSGLPLVFSTTVQPDPAYQPQNRFATFNWYQGNISAYDPIQGTMVWELPSAYPLPRSIVFNIDGATIYGISRGYSGQNKPQLAVWDAKTAAYVGGVQFPAGSGIKAGIGPGALAASVDPSSTVSPLILVPVSIRDSTTKLYDVLVYAVDSNAFSGTYNTIVNTISMGLNSTHGMTVYGCAVTPNGRYLFVSFRSWNGLQYVFQIAVFDMLLGKPVGTFDAGALGAHSGPQNFMEVAPDGQSLLILGLSTSGVPIAVLDISQPTSPTLVATITGTPPPQVGGTSPFVFTSWQVAGSRLFALDSKRRLVVFNFDRTNSNFSQLASYSLPKTVNGAPTSVYGNGGFAVSPDGALVYVANPDADSVTVLDASKLANGLGSLVTNIGTPVGVYQIAVSPATLPNAPTPRGRSRDVRDGAPESSHRGRANFGVNREAYSPKVEER